MLELNTHQIKVTKIPSYYMYWQFYNSKFYVKICIRCINFICTINLYLYHKLQRKLEWNYSISMQNQTEKSLYKFKSNVTSPIHTAIHLTHQTSKCLCKFHQTKKIQQKKNFTNQLKINCKDLLMLILSIHQLINKEFTLPNTRIKFLTIVHLWLWKILWSLSNYAQIPQKLVYDPV